MAVRRDEPKAVALYPAAPGGMIVERPPPGLARGKYPVSPVWVSALGGTLLLLTLLYFLLRQRKARASQQERD